MERFVSIFNNAMELACLGLYEKLQKKSEKGEYRYSPLLKKSLDKFSLLNIAYLEYEERENILIPTDEASLINTFNLPIKDFINKLPEPYVETLQKTEWYTEENYVTVGIDNCYYCMPDLLDKLNNDRVFRKANKSPYKELELISQKFIELLFERSQEEYCEIRGFLENREHAFITGGTFIVNEDIRNFKNKYPDIFKAAYEKLNYKSAILKICPHCGLILREMDDGTLYCISDRCSYKSKGFTRYEELQVSGEDIWVLRQNVSRYIYYPGILEQSIKDLLVQFKINSILWPDKDTWDFQFDLNGDKWVIDAKDVKDSRSIQADIKMKEEQVLNYDKVIYVVPSYRNKIYLEKVRKVINDKQKVYCLTLPSLSKVLNEVVMK